MSYLGDYDEDYIDVNFKFTSRTTAGVPSTLGGTPVVSVYKSDGTTQSVAGVTLTTDFDGVTGLNNVKIDLSADAFYAVVEDYHVVITTGTVNGVSVVGETVAEFSIENRFMRGTDGALTDKAGFSLSATGLDAIVSTATGMVEIAKAIWDRVLTAANHNIFKSAGKILRQATGIVMSDGTAQAGGVNNITLAAGESATDDLYWQSYIAIVGGTGAGQGHHCVSYNGTTKVATMDDDWIITPDATSEYVIFGSGSHDEFMSGLAQAGTASSITLESTADAGDDLIKDCYAVLVSGTGAHQARLVRTYNGTTKVATVFPNWIVNPDSTTGYWILPQGQNNVWDQLASDHVGAGTFGAQCGTEIDAIKTVVDAIDALTQAAGDGDLAAILEDTGITIPGLVGALNDLSSADVLTQVNAALDAVISELSQAKPTATPSLRTGLMLLYMTLRNKLDVDATTKGIYNDAGTRIAKKTLSDDAITYVEDEMEAGP